MADRSHTPFRLGEWLVEPDLNRLSSDRGATLIEPKTMAVLVYLCQRPGQVISANEIIEKVWGGRPIGDNPLYKSVAKLRRALGEDLNAPRYIATVPKKGYRLVATVTDQGAETASPNPRSWPLTRRIIFVAAALSVGLVVAGAFWWQPPFSQTRVELASTFPGSHTQPSFSPDGHGFAFVSEAGGTSRIWVLDSGSLNPRQLTSGNVPDSRPRWSPDGDSIIFQRNNNLWSVSVGAGEPVEIVRDAYNPNWSRDGKRIAFERRHAIWTADADGRDQKRVTGVQQRELPLAPRWPALSPDGTQITYFDSDTTPMGDLWIIPAEGGEPEQLTFASAFGSAPAWTPDGKHIIYSSQRGGSRTLWRVNVADKSSEALLVGSGDDDFPDVTPDGERVIYANSRQRFIVVLSDPELGTHQELYESRQVLVGPELSPDHSTLAFFGSARSGGIQIFSQPLTGGTPTMLTSDTLATHALPQWSSDSESLYFFHTAAHSSFAKVSAAGGIVETVVEDWDWNLANGARVHPVNPRIIYSRLTGQVPVQTRIRDLSTEQDTSFYATLEYPRWSRDGTHVVGSRHVDQRFPGDVVICPIEGPKCRVLAENARIPVWSPDESQVYFVRGFGKTQDLFVVPADGSGEERRVMTTAPLFPLGPFYDVTTDGSIVWIRFEEGRRELWIADL